MMICISSNDGEYIDIYYWEKKHDRIQGTVQSMAYDQKKY